METYEQRVGGIVGILEIEQRIFMDTKLRDEDARVVDMLLDSGSSSEHGPMAQVFTQHTSQKFGHRLEQVEKLLKVLEEMPAMEPPMNMVGRTLSRIEEAEERARSVPATAPNVTHRPLA
jgi:hypothetical protein